MAKLNKLTALSIAKLQKRDKPGRKGDGGGLFLQVRRKGDLSWAFLYVINGRARQLGLGPFPTVSLIEARERARQQRQLLIDGKDPIEVKREATAEQRAAELRTMTFAEACEAFLKTDKIQKLKSDKHRQQWRTTLDEACATLGKLPLQAIDSAAVLAVLQPVWDRAPETGSRLRARIEKVFHWAMPLGLFTGDNPADRALLEGHLPAKPKAKHHASLPYTELPGFMVELRQRASVSAAALEFTILTAMRTGEVLKARWDQIDLDAGVWNAPASIMKATRDHKVPLSDRAVELLKAQPHLGEHVFINGGGKPLSNQAMSELLKGMVPPEVATVHGFRSSFRTWADEQTAYDFHTKETALAHTVHQGKVERAYNRSDQLDRRRRLMAEWSRYCDAPISGATVTPLRAGK